MTVQKKLHVVVSRGEVGRYAFFPGSVERAELIATYFDNPRKIAHQCEFLTYTGSLEGVPVTVISTGIGGPFAVIAVEKLYNCGVNTMIRVD